MDIMHHIQGVVLLDGENGKRLFAKYYKEPFEGNLEKQLAFETKLYGKTHNGGAIGAPKDGGDITLVDSHTVVFRLDPEVYMYVIGSLSENEIMISSVLVCLDDTLRQLLGRNSIDKRDLLENFDLLVLVVDEMIDDGIILQNSSEEVFQLVRSHAAEGNDAVDKLKKVIKKAQQAA
eukprot:TRINITY_DN451_c3_g1_i1.p1 TRINITY_DN451_c3_g1~~TRINITY_DN451_c3_g1_i1.p1  ORF type:complete len:198 (+),score=52.77 TRINITY_DN451_c3_g1_i1:65-595(+)